MLCRISCYFNCHVVCVSLWFMWNQVVRSKHPFRAMCYPVNLYCDRDILCIVIVMYHLLISVQLVSYVVRIQCRLVSLRFTSIDKASNSRLYRCFYYRPRLEGLIKDQLLRKNPNRYRTTMVENRSTYEDLSAYKIY